MLTNRSIPRSTVIPEFAYPDVTEAAAWLCEVFGFTVRIRIGDHRVQLNVGDGAMVVTEQSRSAGSADGSARREPGHDVPGHSVIVRVADANAQFERVQKRTAKIVRPMQDYPYGERQFTVEDFAGHRWTFSESIADVDPAEWGGTVGKL